MHQPANKSTKLMLASALLLSLGLATPVEASSAGHRLKRTSSCQTLREQLVDLIVKQQFSRPYYHRHRLRRDLLSRATQAPRAAAKASSRSAESADSLGGAAGPAHYTTTNNQVVGVDEADRVKTDGRHIYTVHGQEVLIIKSWPASQTRIVARYKPGNSSRPQRLFLHGNKLVVFSQTYTRISPAKSSGQVRARRIYRPSFSAARATILDISDRTSPSLIAHVDLEGTLLQARMVGTDIYLVTNNRLQLPGSFWNEVNKYRRQGRQYRPYRGYQNSQTYTASQQKAQLRSLVRRALAKVHTEQLLPTIAFAYGSSHPTTHRPLLRCSDIYYPGASQGSMGLITLSHMSLNGGRINASAVMGSGMKLYASPNSLYVATNSSSRGQRDTQIHKFDLRGWQGPPRYAASGVVPGYLLNQFSMDEHRGYLRVATTDSGWQRSWTWRGRKVTAPASNIFVLQQRQGELTIAGQVRGLAPGERIYAARMMGDKGYLVTFRRTDPLYTIDLKNPRQPQVMGELKIPGFSSYIHPIGQGRLLTVGQDADERGRVRGAHLQVFDVSDLKNPRRTHHYKLTLGRNSSSSAAQWDHHAFTFNARTRTLALPLTVRRYHKGGGNFTGVMLVKVDSDKGFINLGDVEHSDLAARARCATSNTCGGPSSRYWHAPVQRSIFMDKMLYTLSNYGLKANSLPRMNTVASLIFARTPNHAFLR